MPRSLIRFKQGILLPSTEAVSSLESEHPAVSAAPKQESADMPKQESADMPKLKRKALDPDESPVAAKATAAKATAKATTAKATPVKASPVKATAATPGLKRSPESLLEQEQNKKMCVDDDEATESEYSETETEARLEAVQRQLKAAQAKVKAQASLLKEHRATALQLKHAAGRQGKEAAAAQCAALKEASTAHRLATAFWRIDQSGIKNRSKMFQLLKC